METEIAQWLLLTRKRQEVRSRPTCRDPHRKYQYQWRPRGSSPKAHRWCSNSGIQVTVSTSKDSGLWFRQWSRTVVSLPLCKARKQLARRRNKLEDTAESSAHGTNQSHRREPFTKTTMETKGTDIDLGCKEHSLKFSRFTGTRIQQKAREIKRDITM